MDQAIGTGRLGVGFNADSMEAAAVAVDHHAVLHPAGGATRRHQEGNRLEHFPAHVLDFDQVAGRGREGGAGTPAHASFRTMMDGYTPAMEQPKRQAQEQPGGPDHCARAK